MSTEPDNSVIIIGAGIAGLAAGCYAQMHGFQSKIFELHHLPGGLCTSWVRRGYLFDGSIHYLFGTGAGQPFNQIWDELGLLSDRKVINHSSLMKVVDEQGHELVAYADPERLYQEMISISPDDERLIDSLCDTIQQFTSFDMSALQAKPKELMTLRDWQEFGRKMTPYTIPLLKWGQLSAANFGARFQNRFLQRAVAEMFGWSDIPMMAGISLLAYMHQNNAGFPVGGSLAFAQALEHRYIALGGEIHYNAQVEKILVVDDTVTGVRLYNDEIHHSAYVISCADGQSTIFELLDGTYTDRSVNRLYDGQMPILSVIQASFGVDRDLTREHHWTTYLLDEPIEIADQQYDSLGIKHYCFDPTLTPLGKSTITVLLRSDYDYWQRIYGRKLYDLEQLRVADRLIQFLEEKYPGITQQIEVKDVATPLSYERYTGNHLGSTCGWLLTDKTMLTMVTGIDKRLPGLSNFYMAGQWVEPGGSVPIVACSGRNAVKLMAHDYQKANKGMEALI